MSKPRRSKATLAALAEVRGIIRGWAFAPIHWLPDMILMADIAANSLSGVDKAEANELIAPLRKRLKQETNA